MEYSFFNKSEQDDAIEEISSMPGVSRFGVNQVIAHLEPLVNKGLKCVLLFGVIESLPKVRFEIHILKIFINEHFIQFQWLKLLPCLM